MDHFQQMVGREIDKFDPKKQNYYEWPARLDGWTVHTFTVKDADGTKHKEPRELIWGYANRNAHEFYHVKPLLDRTHTPRARNKVITLPRLYEKKVFHP